MRMPSGFLLAGVCGFAAAKRRGNAARCSQCSFPTTEHWGNDGLAGRPPHRRMVDEES
jgi:hypothetical protein